VAWIDWGPGEGVKDPRNRKDWEDSPAKAQKPGMEAAVMGPYYPRGHYTTKARFETEGVMRQMAPTGK